MNNYEEKFYDPEKNEYIFENKKFKKNESIDEETYFLTFFIVLVLFLLILNYNIFLESEDTNLRVFKNFCDFY